ncbi:MAG TPA: PaaX family transcriptional regulator [Candidatus Binatia bacterium]|jgi:phenylacetic acid degradation operon negative regulatory protein
MKPRPKSVVLDLLSTLRGRSAPVRFLVAAAEIFDIDPNATRVAITRLLACGLIERDERGAYRTGAAAGPITSRLNSWRNLERRTRPWDGSWLGATPDACCCVRDTRTTSVRALEFVGMREFSSGLWVRPDNLDGGIDAARETLQALRLAPDCPVFRIVDLDDVADARARKLWDAAQVRSLYRALTADLERSAARLPRLDEKRAMAESFLIGGEAIRRIVLDPLLPDAIVPTGERDTLVKAMTAYDEIGRRCWAPFIARYGVLTTEAPMDRQLWRDAAVSELATSPGEPA